MSQLVVNEYPSVAIPPHAEEFIRLQRTHYASNLSLAKSFHQDIWQEYETFRAHLPCEVTSVLDVGCGVGGIDATLFHHYGRPAPMRFHMLDKTFTTPKIFYGFQDRGAYYNSLAITRQLLELNGIPPRNIHLMEATDDNRIDLITPVDMAISLLSWGYHYPVATYLNAVHRLLVPGGTLVIDIREKSDGEDRLRDVFSKVTRVWEGHTAWRVVAVK